LEIAARPTEWRPIVKPLTKREQEVAALVADGLSKRTRPPAAAGQIETPVELRKKIKMMNLVKFHTLTRRQYEIVELVCTGISNKEIGRRLNVTEGTVKMHLHAIYQKLGVRNRTVLALWALQSRSNAEKLAA
jgi:DNA-binding NarL/FixJ family response regulator